MSQSPVNSGSRTGSRATAESKATTDVKATTDFKTKVKRAIDLATSSADIERIKAAIKRGKLDDIRDLVEPNEPSSEPKENLDVVWKTEDDLADELQQMASSAVSKAEQERATREAAVEEQKRLEEAKRPKRVLTNRNLLVKLVNFESICPKANDDGHKDLNDPKDLNNRKDLSVLAQDVSRSIVDSAFSEPETGSKDPDWSVVDCEKTGENSISWLIDFPDTLQNRVQEIFASLQEAKSSSMRGSSRMSGVNSTHEQRYSFSPLSDIYLGWTWNTDRFVNDQVLLNLLKSKGLEPFSLRTVINGATTADRKTTRPYGFFSHSENSAALASCLKERDVAFNLKLPRSGQAVSMKLHFKLAKNKSDSFLRLRVEQGANGGSDECQSANMPYIEIKRLVESSRV